MSDRPQPIDDRRQTRRSFLTTSAAIASAAALGVTAAKASAKEIRTKPSVKRGTVRIAKPGEHLRIGVIGTGGMGTGHCGAFVKFNASDEHKVHLVALADVCDERVDNAKRTVEEVQTDIEVETYRDYRELLARDDIHGVLIASPEHWHGQHAVDAITAGKDVYVEKPITLHFSQAMDVRRALEKHPDRIFQCGTQKMIEPKYVAARKAIKEGKIGKPVWSQTSYCRNSEKGEWLYYGLNPEWQPGVNLDWEAWCGYLAPRQWDPEVYARWRRYKDFSTGIVGDLLVHVVTPLLHALDPGWPTRVVATGGHYIDKAMENHDQVNINVEFESDHTMVIAGSTANEVGLETIIRGHEANMYLNGRHVEIRPERLYADIADEEEIICPDIGNDHDRLRMNWLESMRSREPAVSNIDLATKVMVIVDLATRSMWEGAAFEFDPKTMKVTRA